MRARGSRAAIFFRGFSMCANRSHWLLASAALLIFIRPTAADDRSASIVKLLEVGWSISPQARAAADLQYDEMRRVAGADPRGLTAGWLVLMHQRRFDDAQKRLDDHLARTPGDLAAMRAKTWVQAVLKNYTGAFLSADRLSAHLAAHPPQTEAEQAAQDEVIGFLGRLAGYFGGPAADLINQDDRKAFEKKCLDRLDESKQTVFEDARNSVLSKYIEMTEDSADAKERAAATAKSEREKSLAELQTEQAKLDARVKELEESREKLQSELKSEIDSLAKQDLPLAQQQVQLATRASYLNNDLLNYSSQIVGLQRIANQEKNQSLKQQYFNQINSLSFAAGRIESDLAGLNRLVQGIQSQRNGLVARQNQAQAIATGQNERINRELADIARRERRNDGLEKRANRPGQTTTTSKSRSLSAQATALSTYDAFPLEATKAKLLESLR